MAYPLYTSLCGSEKLSQIAVLDIAGLLFGFSVYMGMLGQTENGEKINAKSLFYSALRTPAFIGTVLGIIVGLTRMITRLLDSPFGNCYLSVENILTTAITPIILIVVGYSMEPVSYTHLNQAEGCLEIFQKECCDRKQQRSGGCQK